MPIVTGATWLEDEKTGERQVYSYLRESIGFLAAALLLCQLTVSKATMSASTPARANIHQLSSVL